MKTPVTYTPKIAATICARLAAGESLRAICRSDGMPDESAVRQWVINNDHEFAPQYTRARDIGLDTMADEVFDIADDGTNDYAERVGKGGKKFMAFDAEHVARSRLRFDARRWYLSKLAPKKYGDHSSVDLTVQGELDVGIVEARKRSGG